MAVHNIREQTLDIAVDSEALALALQPHIGDINRRRFLPVIERVLDEFAVPGQQIRIARLDVDLGVLPAGNFEQAAEEALYAALRQAVDEAIREARAAPSSDNAIRPEAASHRELLEHYLARGTLPFWAGAEDFSPQALVLQLAERDPAGLVATVRRLARDRGARERLAFQLDATTLASLLRLLTPEHAALILAYMLDLRQIHRVAPLLTLGESAFEHLLWVLVLGYVLYEAGTQFNRKSFVRALLQGMAAQAGLDYADLIDALRQGLLATQRRHSLGSSLPAVIADLAREDQPPAPPGDAPAAARPARSDDGPLGGARAEPASRLDALLIDDPAGLDLLLRRNARHEHIVRRLVDQVSDPLLRRILALIDAPHAPLIAAYTAALQRMNRSGALLTIGDEQFTRLLWVLVLSYLLCDPGTQFNRKSFVRSLLAGMAESNSVAYADLVTALKRGLVQAEADHASTSLLTVIHDLADELDPRTGTAPDVAGDRERDRLALLEHYLATGRMLDVRLGPDERSPQDLFQLALAHDSAGVARLMRRLAQSAANRATLIEVLARDIAPGDATRLLAPDQQASIGNLTADSGRVTGGAPSATRKAWAEKAWAAILQSLTTDPSDPRDGAPSWFDSRTAGRGDVPIATTSAEIFPHYDQVEIVRQYLRYGTSPWGAILGGSAPTDERVLASLGAFSPAQLRLVFAGPPGQRSRSIGHVVTRSPEDLIVAIIARLLPQKGADTAFRSSLAAFAAQATDKASFYHDVIAALLDDAEVDLEQAATASGVIPAPARPADVAALETPVLKSLLARRLRHIAAEPSEQFGFDRLLRALVERSPEEARAFLSAVAVSEDATRELARQTSAELLHHILQMLHPVEASVLYVIFDEHDVATLSSLPPTAGSPLTADRRRALLVQAVFVLASRPLVDAFVWLLKRMNIAPGSADARRIVGERLSAWRATSSLPAAHIAAFETALAQWAGGRAGTMAEADMAALPERPQEPLLAWLGAERALPDHEPLLRALDHAISSDPTPAGVLVRQRAADRTLREQWAGALSEPVLARLAYLLSPTRYRVLLPIAEILSAAWRAAAPAGQRPAAARAFMWAFLFELLSGRSDSVSPDHLVAAFFARATAADPASVARLHERAVYLARDAGNASLVSILRRDGALLTTAHGGAAPSRPALGKPAPTRDSPGERDPHPRTPLRGKTAFSPDAEETDRGGEPIYVANAGLILTAPFLPHLFRTLDLLEHGDDGRPRLRAGDAFSRAVHLLQYLVDGRTDAPEPRLVLNKLLCGAPLQAPVARGIELTDSERTLCESLLRGMIANWKAIEHTSIAGLRETFLQRQGKLQRVDDGWKLRVQRKTLDVLVDQVPWSLSVIFQAWMPEPIHVTW